MRLTAILLGIQLCVVNDSRVMLQGARGTAHTEIISLGIMSLAMYG